MILAGAGTTVTLIDGLTFAISDALGDIDGGADGLIADDTRHLSRLRLSIDGAPLHSLGAAQLGAGVGRFRGFVTPPHGRADPALEAERRRTIVAGRLDEDIVLRWWDPSPAQVSVSLELDADFIDIFGIRGLTEAPASARHVHTDASGGQMRFVDEQTGLSTVVNLDPAPTSITEGVARWTPTLRRATPWHSTSTW